MTDRPISLKDWQVRAAMEGRLSAIASVLKPQPVCSPGIVPSFTWGKFHGLYPDDWFGYGNEIDGALPHAPGDRLYCREAWAHYQTVNERAPPDGRAFSEVSDGLAGYRADGHETIEDFRTHIRLMSGCDLEAVEINGDRWQSSVVMPRWASRLTFVVKAVRALRVQDVSEADARAMGFEDDERWVGRSSDSAGTHGYGEPELIMAPDVFKEKWTEQHGPGAWDANPWIALSSVTVHKCNIDAMQEAV